MDEPVILKLDGLVEQPLDLRFEDLAGLPPDSQVPDVSRFQPSRRGDGVALEAATAAERALPHPRELILGTHPDRG